jgi:hypothetical protein
MNEAVEEAQGWPLRAWTLATAGAIIGYCAYLLVRGTNGFLGYATGQPEPGATRLAIATFLLTTGIAFGVTWERRRQFWSIAFASVTGLVVASVITFNGGPARWDAADGWRLVCALIAVAIAAPFFQVARDEWVAGAPRSIAYPSIHRHAWTNIVLLCAAFLFVLLIWALGWLLAGLFDLAGLHFLSKLLQRDGTFLVLSGGALGAGLGLLRDRDAILAALQRVVVTIFAVLAPVLAIGFATFLLSLPFTGLAPLWRATRSTTPILITCCVVALLLVNAVIADRAEEEARHPALRWAARLLAAMVIPFAGIAAVSTGLRIAQYGLTPDRLWALTFTIVASAYGLAYATALARGRPGATWPARTRAANLRLAMGLCLLAVLLSTPLISFGALATRDQMTRLRTGRTTAAQFDWLGMRFDFGPSGLAALRTLATDHDPAIRTRAARALAVKDRRSADNLGGAIPLPLAARIRQPGGASAPPAGLLAALDKNGLCSGDGRCFVIVDPSADRATVVYEGCAAPSGACTRASRQAARFVRKDGSWGVEQMIFIAFGDTQMERQRWRAAFDRNAVTVAPVVRHQLMIGGRPAGDVFP